MLNHFLSYNIFQTLWWSPLETFHSKSSSPSSCFRSEEEKKRLGLIWHRLDDDKNSRQHLHYTFLTNFHHFINKSTSIPHANYFLRAQHIQKITQTFTLKYNKSTSEDMVWIKKMDPFKNLRWTFYVNVPLTELNWFGIYSSVWNKTSIRILIFFRFNINYDLVPIQNWLFFNVSISL